jgi:oligosaccharide reducing-end xylanase
MAARAPRACLVALLALGPLLGSCSSTLDSLGCRARSRTLDGGTGDGGGGESALVLGPLLGPVSYPNAFHDLLGKSDSEIAAKVDAAFAQLFHGDPATEAIFVPVGTDQAYIRDVLHDQIRSEGIGLGMLITVSLDKRDEFDRLWRYAKSIQVASGPAEGYFPSFCKNGSGDVSCYDPFGLQEIVTALLLARGRWQAALADIDYGREAASLLDLIRNKEIYNCGVVGGITPTFDAKSKLPYDMPTTSSAGVSRPSVVMPAYYDLWHQATGDPFWSQAAAAGRAYWQASAHPTTGLMPDKATFAGTPLAGFENFDSECARILYNLALDRIWSGGQPWLVEESDRLLRFFYGQGLTTYPHMYTLDGQPLSSIHDWVLMMGNASLAFVATTDLRTDFVSEAWNIGLPVTGAGRYYPGIMQLLGLVILSGQMRIY